jgi:hypothetical protein
VTAVARHRVAPPKRADQAFAARVVGASNWRWAVGRRRRRMSRT